MLTIYSCSNSSQFFFTLFSTFCRICLYSFHKHQLFPSIQKFKFLFHSFFVLNAPSLLSFLSYVLPLDIFIIWKINLKPIFPLRPFLFIYLIISFLKYHRLSLYPIGFFFHKFVFAKREYVRVFFLSYKGGIFLQITVIAAIYCLSHTAYILKSTWES